MGGAIESRIGSSVQEEFAREIGGGRERDHLEEVQGTSTLALASMIHVWSRLPRS